MGEGKILVAIPMGISFEDLKKELENNRKAWFTGGSNMITIEKALLEDDPKSGDHLIFECKGIIDDEETTT